MVIKDSNMIDLSQYYKYRVYIDSGTGKDNTSYYWVRKKDNETGYDIVENIYDVNNDKFVLKEWIADAGHGLINGDNVNLISAKYNQDKKQIECQYNSVNVKDGKLLNKKWLTGEEWVELLKKRDIKA